MSDAQWIQAPTPCPWCRNGRAHWHSFRGFAKDGTPRLGMIISYTDPATFGESVTMAEEAQG